MVKNDAPRLTAASTAELPDMVRECLPPEYAELTLRLFAEREKSKAAKQHAADTKVARIEGEIERAIEDYKVDLEARDHHRRTSVLYTKLKYRGLWKRYDLTQPPGRKTVKRVVERYWSSSPQDHEP